MTWVFDCDLSDGVGWNQHGGAQTGTDQTIETFVFCITDSINMGWSAGWARDTALFSTTALLIGGIWLAAWKEAWGERTAWGSP